MHRNSFVGKQPDVRARRSMRPGLEQLEDRCTPTIVAVPVPGGGVGPIFPIGKVQLSLDGHTLFITGTDGADECVITQNDFANSLSVYLNGHLHSFAGSGIQTIKVDLKGAGDSLEHNLVGDFSFNKTLDYKLGDGRDELTMDFHGVGTVIGGNLDVNLDAGIGSDTVTAHFGRKQGGHLNFIADMRNGNDEVFVKCWGDLTAGADVLFDVRGQDGDDTITSWNNYDENDGNSYVDVSSTSTLTIKMTGGGKNDSLETLYTGKVFGDLTVFMDGQAGDDTVGAVLELLDGSNGDVDAELRGGNDDDRMYLFIDEEPGSSVDLVNAKLNGGSGADDRYEAAMTSGNVTRSNFEGSY